MAEVSLKPKPKESDIAWFSFYLQEHKTHSFGQKNHANHSFYDSFSGHHYTYEPLKCERYLGGETWCHEAFSTSHERKCHRETCIWVCSEPGCGKTGETRKREIDKHTRKHGSDQKKKMSLSLLENAS